MADRRNAFEVQQGTGVEGDSRQILSSKRRIKRRHRTISVENAVSDCGIGTSASPDDHEIRLDYD